MVWYGMVGPDQSLAIIMVGPLVDVRGDRLDSSRMFPPTTVVRYSVLSVCLVFRYFNLRESHFASLPYG